MDAEIDASDENAGNGTAPTAATAVAVIDASDVAAGTDAKKS